MAVKRMEKMERVDDDMCVIFHFEVVSDVIILLYLV